MSPAATGGGRMAKSHHPVEADESNPAYVQSLTFGVHMGIALLSIVDLLTPLQSLASRWMPARSSRRVNSSGLRYVGVRPSCAARQARCRHRRASPARRVRLRVVRMVDAQQPGRHQSRVVISGRMADVCAELDRLVALEAAGAAPRSSPRALRAARSRVRKRGTRPDTIGAMTCDACNSRTRLHSMSMVRGTMARHEHCDPRRLSGCGAQAAVRCQARCVCRQGLHQHGQGHRAALGAPQGCRRDRADPRAHPHLPAADRETAQAQADFANRAGSAATST